MWTYQTRWLQPAALCDHHPATMIWFRTWRARRGCQWRPGRSADARDRACPARGPVRQAEAGRLGHDRVSTEHRLLGLLYDEQYLALPTLGGWASRRKRSAARVAETVGQGPGAPGMGLRLPATKPSTLVLGLARHEAIELDHDRLGTEELLLGLAREGEGVAAWVLQEFGAGLLELREAVAARYAAGIDPEPLPLKSFAE
jgi:ATP-dependent Clp protease ATP-binding subunit ClpC